MIKPYMLRILSVVLFFFLWWLGSAWAQSPLTPGPDRVVAGVWGAAVDGSLWNNLWATFTRVYLGFFWSLGAGILMGVLMGEFRKVHDFLDYWLMLLVAIPSLCWSILGMMWFGLTEAAAIFVIGIIALPVLTINTVEGVKNIDVELLRMAKVYKAPPLKVVREILLPSVVPYLVAGSRYALGLCWKIAIIAEMLGMQSGVGYMIRFNYNLFRMDQVLAWTLAFTIIIISVDVVLLRGVEKRWTRWRGMPAGEGVTG